MKAHLVTASAPSLSTVFPRIVPVGLGGMLVTFADRLSDDANRAALALRAELERVNLPGITETTTSLTSTFVLYDPATLGQDVLRDKLQGLIADTNWSKASLPADRRLWRIPAVFDTDAAAPQLAEAADLAGVSPDEAVQQLCDSRLRVMTLGFAPGQPYLGSLPENWGIPRQQGLTKQVPVGAITVAIRQIVLFSTASPTGWRQVGQCAFRAFRPETPDPFALRPGDEIQFHTVSTQEMGKITARDTSGNGGATSEGLS